MTWELATAGLDPREAISEHATATREPATASSDVAMAIWKLATAMSDLATTTWELATALFDPKVATRWPGTARSRLRAAYARRDFAARPEHWRILGSVV